jgi:prevent-host-death family protein
MRKAGIREARQNFSILIEEVGKGRSVAITDRGRPVAMLVPPPAASGRGLPDLSALRQRNPRLTPALSVSVQNERDDRL